MGIGIGLGSFVGGLERGYGLGGKIKEAQRDDENRAELDAINQDTEQKFDEGVKAGTHKPEQFDEFWTKYALPRRKMELLRQGDHAGAAALQKWGETDEAIKGGRLFSSALIKAQTGNPAGALDDAIAAAKVKGYINHDYDFGAKEELRDPSGTLLGFRVTVKGADGKEMKQDIKLGEIPNMVAALANPDAAWASQVAAKQRSTERQEKIGDSLAEYEGKKAIESRYPKDTREQDPPGKAYDAAYKELSKDVKWSTLSKPEQDKRINQYLKDRDTYAGPRPQRKIAPGAAPGLGSPAPAAPGRKVVFDTVTGQPVKPGAAQQASVPPAQPAGAVRPVAEQEAAAADQAAGSAIVAGRPPEQTLEQQGMLPHQLVQFAIERAKQLLEKGVSADRVRHTLKLGGVPTEQWPEEIRAYP
jgi:hypothetical protein